MARRRMRGRRRRRRRRRRTATTIAIPALMHPLTMTTSPVMTSHLSKTEARTARRRRTTSRSGMMMNEDNFAAAPRNVILTRSKAKTMIAL